MKLPEGIQALWQYVRNSFLGIKKQTSENILQTLELNNGVNPDDWKDKKPKNFTLFLHEIEKDYNEKYNRNIHIEKKEKLLSSIQKGGMISLHDKERLFAALSFYLKRSTGVDIASDENKNSTVNKMIGDSEEWATLLLDKEDLEKFTTHPDKSYSVLLEFLKKDTYRSSADFLPVLGKFVDSFVNAKKDIDIVSSESSGLKMAA